MPELLPAPRLTTRERLLLGVYRAVVGTAIPLGLAAFLPLLWTKEKRRRTIFPRLGWQAYPRDPGAAGRPVWVHSLSLGETLSAVELVRRLATRLSDRPLWVSTSTLSGQEIARERLGDCVGGFFYFPFDVGWAVRRVIESVDPALFVLVETDIWPGFLAEIRRRRIPSMLVNGRLSPSTFRSARRFPRLFRPALESFSGIYPQSEREAERYVAAGVDRRRIRDVGNLKFDNVPERAAGDELEALRGALELPESAVTWIAGSTHPGEEAIVRRVYLRLREDFPDLRLILVPRHPHRGEEVGGLFASDSVNVARMSVTVGRGWNVLVVDRIGYLARLYALAQVAFVGGSLVPKGGQNPIEPAASGTPVLFGPDMHDFPDVSSWLVEERGAIQVFGETELLARTREILADRALAEVMGERARGVVDRNRGTTEKLVEDILSVVQGLSGGEDPSR